MKVIAERWGCSTELSEGDEVHPKRLLELWQCNMVRFPFWEKVILVDGYSIVLISVVWQQRDSVIYTHTFFKKYSFSI